MRPAMLSLWLRVQEPRALSAIYFFAYIAVLVLGAAVAIDPPRSVQGPLGMTLVMCWAWMMLVGGAIGVATALQGAWLFERAGTVLCMFAMAIYGLAVLSLPVAQLSLRIATMSFVIFAILAFAARLVTTRHAAFDPER